MYIVFYSSHQNLATYPKAFMRLNTVKQSVELTVGYLGTRCQRMHRNF